MKDMKILITGSSGFIGKNLFARFSKEGYETYGISQHKTLTTNYIVDITDKGGIENILNKLDPDTVVHCVKLRGGLEYYDSHKDEAKKVSIGCLKNIKDWISAHDKKFILMSTDYVYAGETNNYNEESETKPISFYGEMMLATEKIASEVPNHAILRPTVIFGYDPEGINVLMQILNTEKPRKTPTDQISNPTDVKVLADYTLGVVEKNLKGVYVATGPEKINRFDFVQRIADVFDLNKSLFQGVLTSELSQTSPRPLNNGTDSSKIRKILKYQCPSILESLISIKRDNFKDKQSNI